MKRVIAHHMPLLRIFILGLLATGFALPQQSGVLFAKDNQQDNQIYLPYITNRFPVQNIFGVTMYQLNDANGIGKLAEGRTTWTRREVRWAEIEPVEGQRNWSPSFEQELLNAKQYNIRTVLIVENTPSWALKPGYSCGAVDKDKFDALGNFVFDLVQRYSSGSFGIIYFELWNEPDVADSLGCWGDPSDKEYFGGAHYGKMLKAVYPRIKAANPLAQVLVGGLLLDCNPDNPPLGRTCVESNFLKGIFSVDGGPDFDGVSFHGYDYYIAPGIYGNGNWNSHSSTTGPVSIVKASFLRGILQSNNYSEKYLLNTETAVFYGPNVLDPPCDSSAPPEIEATKVYYVIHSFTGALAEGFRANIWFAALGARCSAFLTNDFALTPKPAFYAYQYTAIKLEEASFIRKIIEYPGVAGYEFRTDTNRIWILWSKDGLAHLVSLPTTPLSIDKIEDNGNPVLEAPATDINVTNNPRFIFFSP